MRLQFLCVLVLLTVWQNATAKIVLPAIIGNNMVLQQNAKPLIWGKALPGEMVKIHTSWNKKEQKTICNAAGEWSVSINTPKAGGPYKISISGKDEKINIEQVMIGEVWLCTGQSNMDMPMKGYNEQPILNADSLIATSENQRIRVFTVNRIPAIEPQKDCKGNWLIASPSATKNFSAVAYQFARKMEQELNVPVGVIVSAFGGTKIQSWMRKESFPADYQVANTQIQDGQKIESKIPSSLYNGMIAPLTKYIIKGFLWYQGESNKGEHLIYEKLLASMVTDWRYQWNNKELPFCSVQIAPYGKGVLNGHFIREAQLKSLTSIPKYGLAVTTDVGKEDKIHPPDKTKVAERLSLLALVNTYKLGKQETSGPILKKIDMNNGMAVLTFDHCSKSLMAESTGQVKYFQIAGEDKKFYDAVAEIISPTQIKVSHPMVDKPVAVRYAFADWTLASLYNSDGLPASSFRTDHWEK